MSKPDGLNYIQKFLGLNKWGDSAFGNWKYSKYWYTGIFAADTDEHTRENEGRIYKFSFILPSNQLRRKQTRSPLNWQSIQ